MAIRSRFPVAHRDVFPAGAYLVGVVEPVRDYKAAALADGSRPQQRDEDTGMLVWSVTVVDNDPEARKSEKAVSVKLYAPVQPVPPAAPSEGFPMPAVEFVGLTALPYVDESMVRVEKGVKVGRGRIAWSYRADDLIAPGKTPASSNGNGAASGPGAGKAGGSGGEGS